jgi:hypothetical protein
MRFLVGVRVSNVLVYEVDVDKPDIDTDWMELTKDKEPIAEEGEGCEISYVQPNTPP